MCHMKAMMATASPEGHRERKKGVGGDMREREGGWAERSAIVWREFAETHWMDKGEGS